MRLFRRPLLPILAALLAVVTVAGASGCAYLEIKERELVYRPVRDYARTPADLGLRYEELWIDVAKDDGSRERIHAWWLPSARTDAPAVLYLHGVRWSLGSNLFRLNRWHQLGFNVLAIDYRGFGRSDGDLPSEPQIHADARARPGPSWSVASRAPTSASSTAIPSVPRSPSTSRSERTVPPASSPSQGSRRCPMSWPAPTAR